MQYLKEIAKMMMVQMRQCVAVAAMPSSEEVKEALAGEKAKEELSKYRKLILAGAEDGDLSVWNNKLLEEMDIVFGRKYPIDIVKKGDSISVPDGFADGSENGRERWEGYVEAVCGRLIEIESKGEADVPAGMVARVRIVLNWDTDAAMHPYPLLSFAALKVYLRVFDSIPYALDEVSHVTVYRGRKHIHPRHTKYETDDPPMDMCLFAASRDIISIGIIPR